MKFGIGWLTSIIILFCGISCDMRWHLDEMQRLPVVKTGEVTSISNTGAVVVGNVEWNGDAVLMERGICYSSSEMPTISNEHVASVNSERAFSVQIFGLNSNTVYRARAYAVNELGVAYGDPVSFTTADGLPSVITMDISQNTSEIVSISGNVTSEGDSPVVSRGICYSTEPQPDANDVVIVAASGLGLFNCTITEFFEGTAYFARAFATNSIGTSYGNEVTFNTTYGGSVGSLDCENVIVTGDLIMGVPANNNSILIPYMNGVGNHNSQAVFSTGVAGLTATIASGAFEAAGGSLLFSITGMPSQGEFAYFNVVIGGQNCSIQIPVIDLTIHTCGTSGVHNAFLNYGSMTDQQGNIYKTIVIGDQEWMAENLNTVVYRNGDDISSNLDNASWENTTTGAWSYSMNNSAYACPYGKLYNWYACVDSRQLCPQGWHMPTVADWSILMNYLGGNLVAGGRMKSLALWGDPNTNASNLSGFSVEIPLNVTSPFRINVTT